MKKILLATTLTGVLVLGACGNEEAEKKEDSKKSESVEKKKEAPKKEAKETEESKEDAEPATAIIPAHQETVEQSTAQEEPTPVEQQEAPVQEQQQEPTDQEKAEANAKVAKEHGYTGLPNGDAMFDMSGSADGYYSNDQLDPDTGLPKDDAVPHKNGEGPMAKSEQEAEPSEWVKGQDEWNNASESERVEMQKESARENGVEYDPKDFEVE